MTQMQCYTFSLTQRAAMHDLRVLDQEGTPEITLRPSAVRTNAECAGQVTITDIRIDGQNQLMQPVDAYQWSHEYIRKVRADALRELGLTGKTHDEIDAYLDEHEMSLPDPSRVALPTLRKGIKVRVLGTFSDAVPPDFMFIFMFLGPGYPEPEGG